MCFNVIFTFILTDGGTAGYALVTMIRCAGDDSPWLGLVPDNGCTSAEHVLRLDQICKRTGITVTSVEGDVCTCQGHMCNTYDICK